MTDEAKPMLEDVFAPWRDWPEYMQLGLAMQKAHEYDSASLLRADVDIALDALCARVWREAQLRVTAMLSCFCTPELKCVKHVFEEQAGPELGAAWHDRERARADAAEAQRDRLAAALWLGIAHATGEMAAITTAQWVLCAREALHNEPPALTEDQRNEILTAAASKPGLEEALRRGDVLWGQARAALADVREVPSELMPLLERVVRDKREGREQYAMSADEYAEKLSREADLVPWPDNLTRGAVNLADPEADRQRRRDAAYAAMREALGFARAVMDEDCDDHGCTHPGCVVYRCVSAALALARQVEE